ncbi:MAG: hypothetical protein JKY37_17925 [Nannocystaceae bacterium]|nr:hypothetical protein [Nannocystaceae bacterium]
MTGAALAVALFFAMFSPAVSPRRGVPWLERVATATLALLVVGGLVGGLGWLFLKLGLWSTRSSGPADYILRGMDTMQALALESLAVGAVLGALAGLATWLQSVFQTAPDVERTGAAAM